ncbi:uncharacterized protein PITG_01989 [Phytophthora infestans T30-4]|uniref:Uncharacterized protein n=1 Tax=Phytophthora infestans (strain T30-4) TaxID=403677 RepID=D0MUL0_PHYIT|nr:uncharacterized protein PITG_01989 [Phytophthora infestans T30-4]EEY61657.1 hypothetical protein PITG_01989 [Phytophthora infestans T30-4]|eukprot:XP_002908574.1 hypothetical protein PITG_01989 [Phytophthora infestans T30-4]
MLLVVGYAYWAWRGYRQAMRDALMRRHERDVERGEHVDQNNYWRRTDPRSPPSAIAAVPVALQASYIKTTEVTYTNGAKTNL